MHEIMYETTTGLAKYKTVMTHIIKLTTFLYLLIIIYILNKIPDSNTGNKIEIRCVLLYIMYFALYFKLLEQY